MEPRERHEHAPDASFDGGDLDCGNGLLLLIRKHIDPLPRGGLLEIRSTERSVDEDLPAWCRMTRNELVSWTRAGLDRSFLVCKGRLSERAAVQPRAGMDAPNLELRPVTIPAVLPAPAPVPPLPALPALAVMGIGSGPRPRWMLQALHERNEGRLDEAGFQSTADDAVRLAVSAQLSARVDVVTDGEQRRDSYASFVGARLDNCQLIPLTDLLPLVDDPRAFEQELRALDVPAGEVRHPAVFGPLGRSRPLAVHELAFVRELTTAPVKVALPGPYLLMRTMWMECLSDRAYASREAMATDIVRVLREEIAHLLAAGAALVQLDEPVLSEVVFAGPSTQRSFMCGALSERGDAEPELAFARDLVNAVASGFPPERLALHVCRGNWTPDESKALAGSYSALVGMLGQLQVGALLLELCTPRAGEMEVLARLPERMRIGIGVCNQKHAAVEPVDQIEAHGERAIQLFGRDRVLLHPDCGFATFADNPIASDRVAAAKLQAIAQAAARLRVRHRVP